jgi:hypothetical protein
VNLKKWKCVGGFCSKLPFKARDGTKFVHEIHFLFSQNNCDKNTKLSGKFWENFLHKFLLYI